MLDKVKLPNLLIYPDPRLQMVCASVRMDIKHERAAAQTLLDMMWGVVAQHNGWGLAAPQLGSPTRVIVVHIKSQNGNGCRIEVVNPVLEPVKRQGHFMSEEGCLSWPGHSLRVRRHRQVKVRGLDRYGDPVTFGGKFAQAACLQHEIEHLDGFNLADHREQPCH